jgi:Fis family transcriptional regulator
LFRDEVSKAVDEYMHEMRGHTVRNLHELVVGEVEAALLRTVMQHTHGNQLRAAEVLGINRGTLRSKLRRYNIK